MSRLALSLLGPFQLLLDGAPVVDFESDRVRALLAFLAIEADKPHRRDRLAGLLWPDWPDRSARANLRNALSSLRKTIADRQAPSPVLRIDRETVQFDSTSDIRVDAHEFKAAVSAKPSAGALENAIALYRGDFLEGFGLEESAPFEEWAEQVREQMRRLCLTALGQLVVHYESRGNLEKAAEYCWRQIDLAPWHEEAHRHLIQVLAASGQRSAALAHYETCRRSLQRELGVPPSSETVALYEQIRDAEKGSPRNAPQPTALTAVPQPPVLPVWLTPFVGRQDLIEEIHNHLRDRTCRWLSLVGPGGSGKTRLAVEASARLGGDFAHGIYFVSLAPLQLPEDIVPTIADVLGFTFQEQENPRRQLWSYLRKKTLLLILDNFEHLIRDPASEREGGVEIIVELLQAAPAVKVLVTSRVGLNVQGEHLLTVPGMAYPEEPLRDPRDASAYSAVELYMQHARRARSDFEPTVDDLTHIVEICRLAQGLPLGLMMAAAWMRILSPAEIATQLAAQRLDLWETEWHDVPERQRSLRAVFDYSWRLQSERERQVLAGLSIFRGGFTHQAAQRAVTVPGGATLRDLMGLVNSSMLHRTPTGRFEMHELLRQYAEEKLRQSPEDELSARDRHSAYYLAALREWSQKLQGPSQPDALAELDAEIDNVRTAWSWAVKHGEMDRLVDGMEGLGPFCDWRARYAEGEKLFRLLADGVAAGALISAPRVKARAGALAWQARFNQRLGRIDRAREQAQQSLHLLEEASLQGQDTRKEKALSLQVIGEIQLHAGNCQDGLEPLNQSLALYREQGDRRDIAQCLRRLGRLHERMGNYRQAAEMHQESVELCRALGTVRDTVDALLDLAVDLWCQGEDQQARQLVSDSHALAQQLGDPATLAVTRYRLAVGNMIAQPSESLRTLEECVAVFSDLGDLHRWALALMRLGEAHLHVGQYESARAALTESLAWYRAVDNAWGIGAALCLMGDWALVQGSHGEAGRFYEESVAAFRDSGARSDVSWALSGLAVAAAEMGDWTRARECLAEAVSIAVRWRHHRASELALVNAAAIAALAARDARALELWSLARSEPADQSCVHRDFYSRYIAPAAARLDVQAAAAAQNRGRTADVWATLSGLSAELASFHP